jgi:hypothetical protein
MGRRDNEALRNWLIVLIAWPLLLVLLPFQTLLVSLVGLRGNMFFLPALLLGSRLRNSDLRTMAVGFAALNGVALLVGAGEYLLGLDRFFPLSQVTSIMFESFDSAGGWRIPSTFVNAHTYALTMADTLPFLFGYWAQRSVSRAWKTFLLVGMASAFVGVMLASTRLGMVSAGVVVLVALTSGKLGGMKRWILALAIGAVIFAALHNDRWQRYKELDKDTVTERIGGSVNRTFFEILESYPMGNGLGGGGTSIPYFLESRVNRPIEVENEYSRILLEQGVVGLLLWVVFIFWFLTNRSAFVKDAWFAGRRMAWWLCLFCLCSSIIGNGMLTAIPNTFLFLLAMGWTSVKPQAAVETVPDTRRGVAAVPAIATLHLR